MDTDLSIFGPVVPLVECQSQQYSQSSSPTASLNPRATMFAPEQSKDANANADADTDAITNKMAALSVAEVKSSPTRELPDPTLQVVGKGIYFVSAKDTFAFSCNTQNIPKSSEGFDVVTKLVAAQSFPHKVQLVIFTGPRLQQIHKAALWFVESLGPYMRTVHQIQLVIVRRGEYINGKWMIPKLDLEKFNPFHDFVVKFFRLISKHVDIVWGASDDLALALRKHYLAQAVPGQQSAFEKDKDKGVDSYSEVISSAMMNNVASKFEYLKGVPSRTFELNPNASPFNPKPNPKAQSFVPAPVYCQDTPMFTPCPGYVATLPIAPQAPFDKQFYELEHPQYTHNHNNTVMGMNMYPGYGAPLRAPTPAHLVEPTGYHPRMTSKNDTPVYATAPQYAQQEFDMKGREKASKEGGKKPHAYGSDPRVGLSHRRRFPPSKSNSQNAENRNDNSYSRGPGNEYGSYAPAHGVSKGLGAGRGYVDDGADKRDPGHNSKTARHMAKVNRNQSYMSQNQRGRARNQDRDEDEFSEGTMLSRTHYPTTSMNKTGASNVSKTISSGFAAAKVNTNEKDKDPVGGGAQAHDHGLELEIAKGKGKEYAAPPIAAVHK